MPSPPSIESVDRIAAMFDPVARNYQITRCYYELSAALAERTGPCANWCTFATWASRQAGQTIRKEDFRLAFRHFLSHGIDLFHESAAVQRASGQTAKSRDLDGIRNVLIKALDHDSIADRASKAVARGNYKVFVEIGRELARFIAYCGQDTVYDEARLQAFLNGLPPDPLPDGRQLLRQAFRLYYTVFFETDAKRRAEAMFHANICIGLHEQTRLQPEVAEALNAAALDLRQVKRLLIRFLFPPLPAMLVLLTELRNTPEKRTPLDLALGQLVNAFRLQVRQFITEHVMCLEFPRIGRIALGADLSAGFPASLHTIADPELSKLLSEIDPTPDSLIRTGATDWADLAQRMHFIADLFRCYQEEGALWDAP